MAKLVNSFNFKNANSKIKPPGEGLPRYIHYNADQSGCGFWRMLWPASQLLIYNKAVVSTSYHMVLDPNFYKGIDAVRLQRQCTENQYRFVKHLRKISNALKDKTGKGFKLIWEVDDVVCPVKDIPDYNKCKEAFTNPQISDTVKRIVHLCIQEDGIIECLIDGLPTSIPIKEVYDLFKYGVNIRVLSKNLETGEIEYKPLLNCWLAAQEADVIEIFDDVSGKRLICTEDHPIKTKRGWIPAGELKSDDVLDTL